MRWIYLSNRLPFSVGGGGEIRRSSGGLVTAIRGIHADQSQVWIGGLVDSQEADLQSALADDKDGIAYRPVCLSETLYDQYYNGFCNNVLWPLFHYEHNLVRFSEEWWRAYTEVNQRFAEVVASAAAADDLVWVHDLHLMLVPSLLRRLRPELRIGFFLHVPFPAYETYRLLPVREDILRGVLDSDLIGFQDVTYLRHFATSCMHLLGTESDFFSVRSDHRTTRAGIFPVGIDLDEVKRQADETKDDEWTATTEKSTFWFLGVDRLDYMKGIDLKLRSFERFLELNPQLHAKVHLVQVAVPTRQEVPDYVDLKNQVEQLVGSINGRFGTSHWVPVRYIYRSVEFPELVALYKLADALLLTSKRDGMNLVAMEYIAAQPEDDPGVPIISEFAGVQSILPEALSVNPWDFDDVAGKMLEAIEMPLQEKVRRHKSLFGYVQAQQANSWAMNFFEKLAEGGRRTAVPGLDLSNEGLSKFKKYVFPPPPGRLIVFADYDGTLAPIQRFPNEAVLPADSRETLRRLAEAQRVKLVVISGRPRGFLDQQIQPEFMVAAEHGAFFRQENETEWKPRILFDNTTWYDLAVAMMRVYAGRVPGSFIEEKEASVVWHYRAADEQYGEFAAYQLIDELRASLSNQPAQVLGGRKIVEVRAIEANKGHTARWYIERFTNPDDRFLCIGDDASDEDMFSAMNDRGVAIRVGRGLTSAQFRINDPVDVYRILDALADQSD